MSLQSRDDGSRSCNRHQRFNDDCRGCMAVRDCQRLMDENAKLRAALLKIYDPMKYHHWEEDPYTRAGCFQFVAQEALRARDACDVQHTHNTREKP